MRTNCISHHALHLYRRHPKQRWKPAESGVFGTSSGMSGRRRQTVFQNREDCDQQTHIEGMMRRCRTPRQAAWDPQTRGVSSVTILTFRSILSRVRQATTARGAEASFVREIGTLAVRIGDMIYSAGFRAGRRLNSVDFNIGERVQATVENGKITVRRRDGKTATGKIVRRERILLRPRDCAARPTLFHFFTSMITGVAGRLRLSRSIDG